MKKSQEKKPLLDINKLRKIYKPIQFKIREVAFNKESLDKIPEKKGVYLLVGTKNLIYPNSKSHIYYIGQSDNLKKRISTHMTRTEKVKKAISWDINTVGIVDLPRYTYGAKYSKSIIIIEPRIKFQNCPKELEANVIAEFYKIFKSCPVANGTFMPKKLRTILEKNSIKTKDWLL